MTTARNVAAAKVYSVGWRDILCAEMVDGCGGSG